MGEEVACEGVAEREGDGGGAFPPELAVEGAAAGEEEEEALKAVEAEAARENDAEWRPVEAALQVKREQLSTHEVRSALDRLLSKAEKYTMFLNRKLDDGAKSAAEEATAAATSKKRKLGGGTSKRVGQDAGATCSSSSSSSSSSSPAGPAADEVQQPELLTGGVLRPYQVKGYNWMVQLYENGLHGILADEMGLGKTVQTVAYIAHLKSKGVHGPFLIVVPLSTITNWVLEVKKWAPSLPVLLYHGSKAEREQLRSKELYGARRRGVHHVPICVTTYDIICRDRKELQGLTFKNVIVDEGHRLKNYKCRLIQELNQLCGGSVLRGGANKILLTGTPLQNNLAELWSLLNFLMPEIFDDLHFFQSVFAFDGVGSSAAEASLVEKQKEDNIVSKLHTILAPFMMRRLKSEVEKNMPLKKELVVYVPMSESQREMYELIVKGELAGILADATGSKTQQLNNVLMQLRKCSLHPYLHYEARNGAGQAVTDERIVHDSGKLRVLDRMLAELRRGGHKVLIFSQFTTMLDIIEDYLSHCRKGWRYCRIDGSTRLEERRDQMHDFNNDPDYLCFLLSTRAGGVGINLVSADTVIIFDSDWNPHQDNQAQDRAHRIGQKRDVLVYRLITARSVELKILERANSKRKLERVVCAKQATLEGQSGNQKLGIEDLKRLLEDDFTGHKHDDGDGDLTDETLRKLLDRDAVLAGALPLKGGGYEIVEHKASSIVGSIE